MLGVRFGVMSIQHVERRTAGAIDPPLRRIPCLHREAEADCGHPRNAAELRSKRVFSSAEQLTAWTEPKPAAEPNETAEPPTYVPCSSLSVAFNKPWLANEDNVERYLQAMREALLEEIRKGKRIRV